MYDHNVYINLLFEDISQFYTLFVNLDINNLSHELTKF